MCGGTSADNLYQGVRVGLSPRVRGNRMVSVCPALSIGSIPACAGEPKGSTGESFRQKVYPRVCGGTTVRGMFQAHRKGLSPRVRGNRADAAVRQASKVWSIPACAGEPQSTSTPDSMLSRSIPACAGEPRQGEPLCETARSIPACAGEPVSISCSERRIENFGLSPRVRGNP